MSHTITTHSHRHATYPDEVTIVDPETGELAADTSSVTTYLALNRVVFYLLSIVEVLLLLRFIFRLFAANPQARFTQLIYTLSEPLMRPFVSIFPSSATAGAVFDLSILVAIIIYYLLALLVSQFIRLTLTKPSV